MTKTDEKTKKPNSISIFIEELRRNSLTVTVLAIISGLMAGGLIAAVTTEGVYAAFNLSFFDGIKAGLIVFWNTYKALFTGSVGVPAEIVAAISSGDATAINQAFTPFFKSLVQSTPYIFAGLAVALGFRVGLFNIGAEGQLYVGALATVWVATSLKGWPAILHVPVSLLAGAAAGGIWGMIPGWLKAKTGAHEVINTIMMNYIAFRLSEYLLNGVLAIRIK